MNMVRISLKARALLAACSSMFVLGSCALTDQQITSIAESAITTGINSLIRALIDGLLTANTA